MKNLCSKTRKIENPYEVWESPAWESSSNNWQYLVLKKYQVDDNKPYARWFCAVKSPHTFGGYEYGDCYVSDVKLGTKKVR